MWNLIISDRKNSSDTLTHQVTFVVLLCYVVSSMRNRFIFRMNVRDRTKEIVFSFAWMKPYNKRTTKVILSGLVSECVIAIFFSFLLIDIKSQIFIQSKQIY